MKELAAAAGRADAPRFAVVRAARRRPSPSSTTLPGPYVVKTDGLAAGKGVLVTDDLAEAEADVAAKLSGEAFGDGRPARRDRGGTGGPRALPARRSATGRAPCRCPPAQDYKRVGDGDAGPNTGGMGAYSPVPLAGDGGRRRGDGPHRRADARRAGAAGDRLPRRALRGADAHRRRAEAGRVQRALRRPRGRGRPAAARRRRRRAVLAGGDRQAPGRRAGGRATTPRSCVVLAAAGYPAAPAVAAIAIARRRASRYGRGCDRLPRRHRPRRAGAPRHRRRTGARGHRRRRRRSPTRATRAYEAVGAHLLRRRRSTDATSPRRRSRHAPTTRVAP